MCTRYGSVATPEWTLIHILGATRRDEWGLYWAPDGEISFQDASPVLFNSKRLMQVYFAVDETQFI